MLESVITRVKPRGRDNGAARDNNGEPPSESRQSTRVRDVSDRPGPARRRIPLEPARCSGAPGNNCWLLRVLWCVQLEYVLQSNRLARSVHTHWHRIVL